ncbi:MAG: RHS repeat-associated core domain-containing protein [Nitrospirae bacterium]|nr:RHS repeat-associated core domain-containing protein [Nitrospirota bacterium]
MVTPVGQLYCYHYNATGGTVAVTDSDQEMVNKYAYDPFGNLSGQCIEAVPQPFKYVGQFGVMAEPNGFYYMRARYYDPKVGRFVSEDPSGFVGGDVNLMAYVGNNPINFTDPLGLFEIRVGDIIRVDIDFFGIKSVNEVSINLISHEFLSSYSKNAGYASGVALFLPGGQTAGLTLAGSAAVAQALDIYLYSENKEIDNTAEVVKTASPLKFPYNLFWEAAIDLVKPQSSSTPSGSNK